MSFRKEGQVHAAIFVTSVTAVLLFLLCLNAYRTNHKQHITESAVISERLMQHGLMHKIDELVFSDLQWSRNYRSEWRADISVPVNQEEGVAGYGPVKLSFRLR